MEPSDRVVRAITNDNAFRVITIRATETVRAAVKAQKATGKTAEWFGELLTGTVLVRETMSPDLRVQTILQGEEGAGSLVGDALPQGKTRGLVNSKAGSSFVPNASARLQVVRTMARGQLHQGIVQVGPDISNALTAYMVNSEQVVSEIGLGCLSDEDGIKMAGGYIVQILPEHTAEAMRVMTARLQALPEPRQLLEETACDPDRLLAALLGELPHTRVNESEIGFGCLCDQARVVGALASLGKEEIRRIIEAQEVLSIACDYCGTQYQVSPGELRGLLDNS
ncbi:MAG: Hsp33 family molecular chaperone HslO [Myxococcota bacterium]